MQSGCPFQCHLVGVYCPISLTAIVFSPPDTVSCFIMTRHQSSKDERSLGDLFTRIILKSRSSLGKNVQSRFADRQHLVNNCQKFANLTFPRRSLLIYQCYLHTCCWFWQVIRVLFVTCVFWDIAFLLVSIYQTGGIPFSCTVKAFSIHFVSFANMFGTHTEARTVLTLFVIDCWQWNSEIDDASSDKTSVERGWTVRFRFRLRSNCFLLFGLLPITRFNKNAI